MTARSYEEWKSDALRADAISGAEHWKSVEKTDMYAYKVIRRRYDELVSIRESGDIQRLLFYLNEGIHGNMGGMGAPKLYTRAKFGTKTLITLYVEELAAALQQLLDADESQISLTERMGVFRQASLCYGRSALMLSGAGARGPFHLGVVKALHEQGLLPRIISGASAGSVVAGIVGTCPEAALLGRLSSSKVVDSFRVISKADGSVPRQHLVKVEEVIGLIETLIPDMTFAEAYEESGRYINISVAAAEVRQRSRLLNAITSPNALIRESLLASCAVPGVFPAVVLAARDHLGNKKAYVPSRKWVDGSISGDLPTRRLSRLYSVNHFISSQTNPLVLWALQDPQHNTDPWSQAISMYQSATREWFKAMYPIAMEMLPPSHPQNVNMRMLFDIVMQEYTADITILPKRNHTNLGPILSSATSFEAGAMVRDGESATWPKIEQIRINTLISRKLDQILSKSDPAEAFLPLLACSK